MKSNKQTFRDTKQQTTLFLKHTTHTFLLICFILSLPFSGIGQNVLKTRTIEQTNSCNGTNSPYSFYISKANSTFDERSYQIQNGQFTEYDNGTARITGLAVNNADSNIKWRIDVGLANRTFNVDPDSVKAPGCHTLDVSDWYLYTQTTGTFTGEGAMQGAVANMYRRGPAFQLGTNGNETEITSRFNGCGWHHIEFTSQPNNGTILENTVGDLNLNLTGTTLTEQENCTGEIVSFKISGDNSSITLQDGGSYQIGDLPANSTIEAVATGSHESIGFNVNGAENEENTVPYDHYWTPAVGTYTISASLFNEDNCSGIKCDEKTITITITNNILPPTNVCVKYKVSDSTPECGAFPNEAGVFFRRTCPSPTFEVWKAGDDLILQETGDGTAALTGSVYNGTTIGIVNIEYWGYSSTGTHWNNECYQNQMTEDYFYNHFEGSITIEGVEYSLIEKGASHVFGPGANNESAGEFGFGGWLDGTWGNCVESFGTLTPIQPGTTCDDGNSNTITDIVQPDGCTCAGVPKASIGNFVWTDTNNNGIQDTGEPGISNVVVMLLDGNGNMVSQTTTDQNGQYIFDVLTAGSYKVKFPTSTNTNGSDYILTTPNNGDETKDSDAQPIPNTNDATTETITLNTGDNYTDLDAGYILGCSNVNFDFSATTSTDIACNNSNNGQIDLSLTGGTAPYNYNWSNGTTTQDLNNLSPGNYTVTVIDANGCEGTYSANISEPTAISASTDATNVACSGGDNGAVQVSVDGGTAPYSFNWNNGATTQNINSLTAGSYTVTITDANNCSTTAAASVDQAGDLVIAVDQTTNVSCNDGNDGSVSISVTGGTAPYSYNWSNGATTEDLTDLSAGEYTGNITDANGCSIAATVTISEPAPVNATASATNVACSGGDNGAVQVSVDGGTAPYSFNWNNGATTQNINSLTAGSYTVTITDANNCSTTAAASVDQAGDLVIEVDQTTNVSCNDGNDGSVSISVTGGTAPYSYNWSNSATTEDLTDLSAGEYTGNITDANGCSIAATVTISEPAPVNATASATNVACSGGDNGAVQVSVDGGTAPYSFNWNNGATTQNINSLTAGNYTVTITDANNCATTATASVDQAGDLLVNVTQSSNSSCNGDNDGVISISVTGGTTPYSYEWSNGATTEDLINLTAGEYTVTITDANDCSVTATATFTEPTPITATTEATNVACSGGDNGTVQVTVEGGTAPYSFNWSNGATTQSINSLTAGSYTVTITDANNCSTTAAASVDQAGDLLVTVDQTTNVSCHNDNDGAASISVDGGTAPYSFDWSNGATTQDLTGLTAGNYTTTITDANGCSNAATVTITEPEVLGGSLNITNITCSGNNTGKINLSVSGGSAPYSFSWSNGEITRNLSNQSAGVYSVTITDVKDCAIELSGEILETAELQIETQRIENVTCQGNSDGLIDITIVGGTAPYSYNWSNGANSEDLSNLSTGSYQVTVTDVNGCEGIYESAITEPEVLECKATILENLTTRGGSDASLSASALGGIAPYSYLWSTQQTTAEINNLSAGSYQVTITDQNGCQCETTIKINDPASVGDFVWEDLNGDGIQDPTEPGIPNVEVTLTGIDANGNNVSLTATTDENGQYDFDGLLPGTYKITFSTPTNFASTPANVGNDAQDSDAQNGMTPEFTIEYGDEDLSFDAGFYNPVNIGNFVWFDANNNGIQDVNEAGVNGVTVNLFDLGPDETFGTSDDILVGTQTTQTNNGADGSYQFTGVAPGKYAIKFDLTDLPVDYDFTIPGASGNTVDSNVDPVTGVTETIMVVSGQTDDNSIDAGLVLACDVTAAFTTQQEFCEDELAQFTAEDAGPGATYEWVFFNGPSNTSTFIGTRSGYDVPFRFTSPGEKFVKLLVTLPNGCQAIEERVLSVGGNITSGGTIGSDEENCGAFDPTIITNLSSPTGGNGNFAFIWMKSNQPTPPTSLQDPAWELIPNANGLDYDPEMIEETTYYIRCSRMEYCTDYIGETNIVVKSVNGNLISEFSTDDYICWKRPIEFMADLQESGVSYQWVIFRGEDQTGTYLGARDGATMDFTFNQAGAHYIQLQVSLPNGCTGTYGEKVFVDGYSRVCGDSINLTVVTALNFDAQPKDDGTVLLTWEISNEPSNVQYTIEHSTGDDDFAAIGNVKGDFSEHYEFVDDAPMFGINYYRLKYIYEDGSIDFSDIKQVVMRFDDKQKVNVFPNPTQDITRLRLAEPDSEDITIELINGQGITLEKVMLPAGETDVEFDLSMYESGHYFIYMLNKGRKSLLSRVMKVTD